MKAQNDTAGEGPLAYSARDGEGLLAGEAAHRSTSAVFLRGRNSLRTAARLMGQCALVYGVFAAASWLVQLLHLPLPASLAGVLLFLLLLATGAVTPAHMRELSDLIAAHLSFFFVPLVVMGVASWAGVLVQVWPVVTASLLGSAVVGVAVSGLAAQAVLTLRGKRGARACKP